ncbi:hypothetical protein QA633_08525 [Bradyrhizobium barranii]|uniref:hypothetical protein n=1 Tax=Bradyrhizobium barranii TaxID=2992140 RepID=UPI0024B0D465|nr:hypothetical protein [Bradyrhizobium barranii]WFT97066.1 hypothetical protein QA633_08525 [Bradyrhizobium barranii]
MPSKDIRARFLEYTLEKPVTECSGSYDQFILLRADFQSHWATGNNMPALLFNTTDAGSGKRAVISPFDFDPLAPKDTDLCVLAAIKRAHWR